MTGRSWGRDRERRLQRFGLVTGLVLALVVHLYIFFGPRVSYKPVLERAKVRRVLVAKLYRPQPPPKPAPIVKPADPAAAAQPKKVDDKSAAPAKLSAPEKGTPAKKGVEKSPVAISTAVQKKTVESATSRVKAGQRLTEQSKEAEGTNEAVGELKKEDQWEELLAQMEEQHGNIETEKERLKTQQQRVGTAEEGAPEGFLEDSRIRIKVISYPPSAIEQEHPAITYPALELRESQLQSGICRVYFRIWTDEDGNIVKEQIKTPEPGPERERYKIFIDRVVEEVRFWSLPRQKGEIHIDVLFEIE